MIEPITIGYEPKILGTQAKHHVRLVGDDQLLEQRRRHWEKECTYEEGRIRMRLDSMFDSENTH